MNRLATNHRAPIPAAVLDLTDESQRAAQRLIERTHTGRWPLWRAHAMHREGNQLYALAEWVPRSRSIEEQRFIVLTWSWDESAIGVRWQRQSLSRRQAVALFAQSRRGNHPADGEIGIRLALQRGQADFDSAGKSQRR